MKAITVGFLFVVLGGGSVTCDRIQNYIQVGTNFLQNYYASYDNLNQRARVRDFYDFTDSAAILSGTILFGADQIMNKINTMNNVVQRNILFSDLQPTSDGGVILNVFGRISYDVNTGTSSFFSEMFVIKPRGSTFYIQNQHFRASTGTNNSNNNNNNADSLHFV